MRAARAGDPAQTIDRKRLMESGLDVFEDTLELRVRKPIRAN